MDAPALLKERVMRKLVRYVLFVYLSVFLAVMTACTGAKFPDSPSLKEIPITDIKQVVGKWEGVTWAEPRVARQDDWVKVAITENGAFNFSSYRMIGAWLGSGKLRLENGKLVTEPQPDTGNATFTLYKSDGRPMLKVKGTTKTDRRQEATLNPVKN